MAAPRRVLLDTAAIYAVHSPADEFHHRAVSEHENLVDRNRELWITSYALVETVALLRKRMGFSAVTAFAEWASSLQVQVLYVEEPMHSSAWERYTADEGRGLSFVDWVTAIASRELDAQVFTFDGGFARQGFSVVPR